ncbi:MAG: glycosyltransferase [Deltaproteobacteria bacterium]|nr:glycosyltransferase [Deltaproteobacteria bacterium]
MPWDILVMVTNYVWDGRPDAKRQPPHYLASAWASQLSQPVLVVNLIPWSALLRRPTSWWRFRPGLHRSSTPGLWVLNLLGPEWREASHAGARLPIERVEAKIRHALRSLGLHAPLLVASEPAHCRLFAKFAETLNVWYCTDDFGADDAERTPSIRDNEAWALAHADLVVTVSAELRDALSPKAKKTVWLPNGVDAEELRSLAATSGPVSGWQEMARPRIAFLGSVDNRVAYGPLLDCVQQHPTKSFLLIGSVYEHDKTIEEHVRKLRALPNVHFLGMRNRREIAWILSQCDAGLIPYEVNEFNRACSPLKVFEYAALGLPVIAAALPALREYGQVIGLIDMANLADTLDFHLEVGPTRKDGLRAFADANTWSLRAKRLAANLQEVARTRSQARVDNERV